MKVQFNCQYDYANVVYASFGRRQTTRTERISSSAAQLSAAWLSVKVMFVILVHVARVS